MREYGMTSKRMNRRMVVAKIFRKLKMKQLSQWFNTKRHKAVMQDIASISYKCLSRVKNGKGKDKTAVNNVWVFWWQGENQMPQLVKQCYTSLKNQLVGKKIILITKDNIREYCTFPDYIFEKYKDGKITLTHLSDILRFDLLSHYGGLYTDATVFWTGDILTEKFEDLYTCGGYSDEYYFNVSRGKWTGFLIGGSKENPLFTFMYDFFLEYWKQREELIDYFLVDYALQFAYENNIGGFKDYADNVAILNNPNLFELMRIRNQTYSEEKKRKLLSNTCAFKLSYKKKFNNGNNTYANQIIFAEVIGES